MQERALLNHYYYFFPDQEDQKKEQDQDQIQKQKDQSPAEKKSTSVSSGDKNNFFSSKDSEIREGSPPHSSENSRRSYENRRVLQVVETPLNQLAEEIKGEIYKKGIWISKQSLEHFRSLEAYFDPIGEDKELFRKIEDHFGVQYNQFKNATVINKEEQAKRGISFNVQMWSTGYFRVNIKKHLKDVELFLRHFYQVFHFLEYEELARMISLFQNAKTKRAAFKYIHLANKTGPKPIIDEDFKGAHIIVKYYSLKTGQIAIDVKIDYSDPHHPEIEFEGPEAPCRNLRDIVVKPAETLSTIDNIGGWTLEARNNILDIKSDLGPMQSHISSNHQQLQTLQKSQVKSHNDVMSEFSQQGYQLNTIEELQQTNLRIQQKQLNLDRLFLEQQDIIQTEIVDLNQELDNGIQILSQKSDDLKQHITEENDLILDGQSHLVSKLDKVEKSIKKEIKDSKNQIIDHFSEELNSFRTEYVNNLYLILRAVQKVPNLTTKELIAALKEELNVSKGTIYKYFRQLREKDLLEAKDVKLTEGPGGPSKLYNLTKKAKELLSNLLKRIK